MDRPTPVENDLGFRKNAEALLTGQQILDAFESGTLDFQWMGRAQGIDGERLARDIAGGGWRTQVYECRRTSLPGNPNWFAVKHFVRRLGSRKDVVVTKASAESPSSFVPVCRKTDSDGECTQGMADPRFCGLCSRP